MQYLTEKIANNALCRSLYALFLVSMTDYIGYKLGAAESGSDLEKSVGIMGAAIGFYGTNIALRNQYQAKPGMKVRIAAGAAGAIVNYFIIHYLFELAQNQSLLEHVLNFHHAGLF